MNRSPAFFLGALSIAFLVFITTRGELREYLRVVFGIEPGAI